jgi:hypothetical protein
VIDFHGFFRHDFLLKLQWLGETVRLKLWIPFEQFVCLTIAGPPIPLCRQNRQTREKRDKEKENIFYFFVKYILQEKFVLHLFKLQIRQPVAKLQPGYLVAQQLAGNTQKPCRSSHVAFGLLQGLEDHFFLQILERSTKIEILRQGSPCPGRRGI